MRFDNGRGVSSTTVVVDVSSCKGAICKECTVYIRCPFSDDIGADSKGELRRVESSKGKFRFFRRLSVFAQLFIVAADKV